MYAPKDMMEPKKLKAVCAGVILEADLILTSRECLRHDLENIRFDMVKKWADKQEDQYWSMFEVQDVHEWALADDMLGTKMRYRGDLIVYELKEKMRLDENTIYAAHIPLDSYDSDKKTFMSDFDECKLYAFGGNERLYSLNVTETDRTNCHKRPGLADSRVCVRLVTEEYNLCLVSIHGLVN